MIQHSEFYKKIKNRYTFIDGVLLFFLICVLAYICYTNFTQFNFNINSDIINEIQYYKQSWLQKTPYPQGFICSSESFANRPFFIYWLFYAITGDFIFSYQCVLTTTLFISALLLYHFLRNIKISRTGGMLGVCLFLVMLPEAEKTLVFQFCNTYVEFLWVILLTLMLRYKLGIVLWEQEGSFYTKAWVRYFAGMLLISCLIGFTTIRMLLFLYGPIFLIDCMRVVWRFINHRQIHANHLVMVTVSGLLLLSNICAYTIFTALHSETISTPILPMAGIKEWTDWSVLSAQLQGLLASFSDFANTSSITLALSFIFVFFELIVITWFIFHKKDEAYAQQTDLFLYWCVSTAAVFFSQVFMGSAISIPRFFFPSALIIFPLCICAVERWGQGYSTWLRYIPKGALLAGLVVMSVTVVRGDLEKYCNMPKPVLQSVAEYIQDNGYSYVTATYWNAGVITGFTNGAVESQHTKDGDPINFYPYNWMIDTRKFADEQPGIPNTILLTDEEEKAAIEGNWRMAFLLDKDATKVAEIENYNLYEMSMNPFCALDAIENKYGPSLPTDIGTSKEVTYTSGSFSTRNGILQEDGSICSDGTANFVIFGPYEQTVDGVYEITLNYQISSYANEDSAVFDVAIDQESLYAVSLNKEQITAKLSNVKMESGHQFEVRVYVPEGMIIQIESIEYVKIS